MRLFRFVLLLPLALGACRSGKTETEAGAVMLQIKCAAGVPLPDELRVWVYDDAGRLWDGARVPPDGKLVPKSAQELGTVLIQPGPVQGKLRIHVRGLAGGARALDGVAVAATEGSRTADLLLDSAELADADGDGVPDAIDDCPGTANAAQGGCPGNGQDAGAVGQDVAAELPGPVSDDANSPGDDVPKTSADAAGDQALVSKPEAGDERLPDAPPSPDVGQDDAPVADAARTDAQDGSVSDSPLSSEAGRDGVRVDDVHVALGDAGMDSSDANSDAARDAFAGVLGDAADGLVLGDAAPNLPQGAACRADGDCASGFCADGVCCTNACVGPCRSCNQPSANGVCQAYASGTNPESECTGGTTCNGAGACGAPPPPNLANGHVCNSGAQCASGYCVDGVCCNTKCSDPCLACGSGICLTVRRTVDIPECSDGKSCDKKGDCI